MARTQQERYSRIVSSLNQVRDTSGLESILEEVIIDEILELLGFSSLVVRIRALSGGTDTFINKASDQSAFCFDDLEAPECVCAQALKLSSAEVIVTDKFGAPNCNNKGYQKLAVANIPVDDSPCGLMMASSQRSDITPDPVAINIMGLVCAHIGQTVSRIGEHSRDRKLAEELETVNTVGRLVTSKLNIRDMTREIITRLSAVLENDEVNVILYDNGKRELSFLASYFADGSNLERPETYPLSDGINSWIIKNRLPLLMTHDSVEECARLGIRHGGKPARSWLGAPMIYHDRVQGVLSVQSYCRKGLYSGRSIKLMEAVAAQCAVAVENARLFEEVTNREKEKEWLYFSLTHDLRSLINPVSGFARLLDAHKNDEPDEVNRSTLLQGVITSSERLTRFVDDILVYSKIKSGKLTLNVERADVMKCVEFAILTNLPEFEMRSISVFVNDHKVNMGAIEISENIEADFDVPQIERALLNLLNNAAKHARSKIDITVKSSGGIVTCSIIDDGAGVTKGEASALFDEYYQADSKQKGVGLGLPTVKKLVDLHHGTIFIDPDFAPGFKVEFSWPRTLEDREEIKTGEPNFL